MKKPDILSTPYLPGLVGGGKLESMTPQNLPPFFAGKPLPALEEVLADLRIVRLPLKVKFRGITERETALLKGPAGWAEFAPFLEYGIEESSAWLASALEAAWLGYPEAVRQKIPLNSTLPAVAAERVEEVLANYSGPIHEVKIKVAEKGQSLADDIARVGVVRKLLPQVGIKIDANMGWSLPEAVEALSALAEFDLLYAEQPVAGVEDLARVREALRDRGISTLIAADESVRKAEDPLRVAQLGAADLLIVKAAPLGGVRRARAIVAASGLAAVVSSALESSVGIRTGAALAACLPELPFGCGLGTVSLFGADIVSQPLTGSAGYMDLPDIYPDEDLLAAHEVVGDRRQWWIERLKACYYYLSTE